jgi:hypothetical protein
VSGGYAKRMSRCICWIFYASQNQKRSSVRQAGIRNRENIQASPHRIVPSPSQLNQRRRQQSPIQRCSDRLQRPAHGRESGGRSRCLGSSRAGARWPFS